MRILFKEPGKEPRRMVVPDDLKTFQNLVGGNIEAHRLMDGINVLFICNEEGKLRCLEPNFYWRRDLIVGPVIFVGDGGDGFDHLPEDAALEIKQFVEINKPSPTLMELWRKKRAELETE